ncbi:MAG: tetratricopeptide repeat protein [Desulfobacteraceae bacterium]|nr:tetratricopeptide repeat protein [Desulfobacteraceae bacterium]
MAKTGFADSPRTLVEQGNAAYKAGKYDDALSAYDRAAGKKPSDAWIDFNKGAAFFRKGEMDKAKDAWEKASLGATETPLEAKSLYNLGTLEFSKVTQAQAKDPKSALEAADRSIRYYHEVTDLLNKSSKDRSNPLVTDASENIELVRRTMKAIQEEMARQKKAAQEQKQAAEDLKNLIRKQQDLNARAQEPSKTSKPRDAGKQEKSALNDMAQEQSRLREQTQKTAEKLSGQGKDATASPPGQTGQAPDPAQSAKDHLKDAQSSQQAAVDKLKAGQVPEAMKNQKSALEEMKNALDLLQYKDSQGKNNPNEQNKTGQEQSGQKKQDSPSRQAQQQGETGQNQNAQPQRQDQPNPAASGNPGQQPDSGTPMILKPDDAEHILGEEKENKKIRQEVAGAGGYQDVDKDW